MEPLTLATMTTLELEAMAGLLMLQTERLHITPRHKQQVLSINNNVEVYPPAATDTWNLDTNLSPEITSSSYQSNTTSELEELVREAFQRRSNVSAERAVLAVTAVRSAPSVFSTPASANPFVPVVNTAKAKTSLRVKKYQPRRSVQSSFKEEVFDVIELTVSDEEWQPTDYTRKSKQQKRRYTTSSGSNKENMDMSESSDPDEEKPKTMPDPDMIAIGEGYAKVPARLLKNLDWRASYTTVTRKLLTAVFPRSVLATHSLTGKPSPAFPNKPAKKKLDAALVNDIVITVAERCQVPETVVRTSITTKCADESKMLRSRQRERKKS